MLQSPVPASRPPNPAAGRGSSYAHPAWAGRAEAPSVAVLMTGCRDPVGAARGYRTVLPRAHIALYGHGLPAREAELAEAAGAAVRDVPPCPRDALVRRMFAEVDADIYILAHGAGPEDVCVAPLVVAEVDGGKDLVDVLRSAGLPAPPGFADRILAATVDFAFGGHGGALGSDFKACSRRFALSYRRTSPRAGRDDASARDLALHALRLRLPVGQVASLALLAPPAVDAGAPARSSAWTRTLALSARLLVEERPRRVFGLLGIAVGVLGLALIAPDLEVHRWHASLAPGARALTAGLLLAAGVALGAAGLLFDALASARQEVRRVAAAAIPRRADRPSTDHPSTDRPSADRLSADRAARRTTSV